MRRPMRVEFVNEPAIDEGGVIKEYFQLLLKEIFNPDYAMFLLNPDIRMYWFNGFTFEPPINFELVGTLLGLASSN
jgi:ubiquitin-protein ligase E3 A